MICPSGWCFGCELCLPSQQSNAVAQRSPSVVSFDLSDLAAFMSLGQDPGTCPSASVANDQGQAPSPSPPPSYSASWNGSIVTHDSYSSVYPLQLGNVSQETLARLHISAVNLRLSQLEEGEIARGASPVSERSSSGSTCSFASESSYDSTSGILPIERPIELELTSTDLGLLKRSCDELKAKMASADYAAEPSHQDKVTSNHRARAPVTISELPFPKYDQSGFAKLAADFGKHKIRCEILAAKIVSSKRVYERIDEDIERQVDNEIRARAESRWVSRKRTVFGFLGFGARKQHYD